MTSTSTGAWGASASPWAATQTAEAAEPASFRDLMSEDLAKNLHEKEQKEFHKDVSIDVLTSMPDAQGNEVPSGTDNDLLLAQMLQYEYDQEHDEQLSREERQQNKSSKVSVSYSKYKTVPDWYGQDAVSRLEEADDDAAIDSFEARERMDPDIGAAGYVRRGDDYVTKHDPHISGRRNAQRLMEMFPPNVNTGDGGGFDMELSNNVFNKLQRHSNKEASRKSRVHDKSERSTSESALDRRTYELIFKMVNNNMLGSIQSLISSGKESVVIAATGGEWQGEQLPKDCAIKVYKTTLTDFKNREKYIRDDQRFKDRYSRNTTKAIRLWAEKEYFNLRRLGRAGIPCPRAIVRKNHLLVMSLVGSDRIGAPKLKDAFLTKHQLTKAYHQVVDIMTRMFKECRLIHADLSEYNLLWHEEKCWVIDVGQSVEPQHPSGLQFLLRDCDSITKFFLKRGVSGVFSVSKLFQTVSGMDLPDSGEEELSRVVEAVELRRENMNDVHHELPDTFERLWHDVATKARCDFAEEEFEQIQQPDVESSDDDDDWEHINYDDEDFDDDSFLEVKALGGNKAAMSVSGGGNKKRMTDSKSFGERITSIAANSSSRRSDGRSTASDPALERDEAQIEKAKKDKKIEKDTKILEARLKKKEISKFVLKNANRKAPANFDSD